MGHLPTFDDTYLHLLFVTLPVMFDMIQLLISPITYIKRSIICTCTVENVQNDDLFICGHADKK